MKYVKQTVAELNGPMATANTVNAEGAKAWTKSDVELLTQYAMTGTLGNSFYADAKKTITEATKLLERAEAKDIFHAIVIGRNEGYIRSFNILGLVYLSSKDSTWFRLAFPEVIKTGGDMKDFIDLINAKRGFGRAIKSAINAWLVQNISPYYAQKYRGALADAIRMARFKTPEEFEHAELVSYILGHYPNVAKNTPEKMKAALDKYPVLEAKDRFVKLVATAEGKPEALALMKEHKFEVDSLTSVYSHFTPDMWKEIAKQTPTMKFIKFLNKFILEGAIPEDKVARRALLEQKINVEALKKAKVFPYRLAIAIDAVSKESQTGLKQDMKVFVIDHLNETLDNYVRAYDWDVFNKYTWAIYPDVSGSMTSVVNGGVRPTDVSSVLTGCFMRGLKDTVCKPWDDHVHTYDVSKSDPVARHVAWMKKQNGGGTDMSCALRDNLQHRDSDASTADCHVFITDTEEFGDRSYGSSWIDAWKKFKAVHPAAKAFIVRVDTYPTSPVSEELAKKYDVYQIYGWNDTVFGYIKFVLNKLNK